MQPSRLIVGHKTDVIEANRTCHRDRNKIQKDKGMCTFVPPLCIFMFDASSRSVIFVPKKTGQTIEPRNKKGTKQAYNFRGNTKLAGQHTCYNNGSTRSSSRRRGGFAPNCSRDVTMFRERVMLSSKTRCPTHFSHCQ